MVQIKIFRNSPELVERDVNQWVKQMYDDQSISMRINSIDYTTPHVDTTTVMITYTLQSIRQRSLANPNYGQPNKMCFTSSEPDLSFMDDGALPNSVLDQLLPTKGGVCA